MVMIKLRMMQLLCDFMLDWYYFRKLNEDVKKKKMENVNNLREDIVDLIQKERREKTLK